ncbi:MAG: hypothetical protein LAO07_14015, partial [Acidobacteriia bacterium]|nr:hypothetical protein [Terriglobia bacterium]
AVFFLLRKMGVTPGHVRRIRYRAGETEKELFVKNNSGSEAQFISIYSESDAFEVTPALLSRSTSPATSGASGPTASARMN